MSSASYPQRRRQKALLGTASSIGYTRSVRFARRRLRSVRHERVEQAQVRETTESVVVRREHEPVLDRERGDLDVRDVVAAQARRLGELGGDPGVSRTGRDEADSRLLEVRGRDRPALFD